MENEYWPAKCRACGWRGSSEQTNGGLPIADTGDCSELRCPACDSTLIDEADEAYPADADEPMTVGLDCCPHDVPYGSDCDECDEEDADMARGLTPNNCNKA